MECWNILINTAAGFPEYLSQHTLKAYSCIQEQDFPSIWASTLSKHIPVYSSRISRVFEPVECQNMLAYIQQQDFPSIWASKFSIYICAYIYREDFPSIWASGVSLYMHTYRSRISWICEPVHFQIKLNPGLTFTETITTITLTRASILAYTGLI